MVAGRPWAYVRNVSRPTLTVYPPKGKSTGAAVIVFLGGGYRILAIDLEGTEVCDWLTSKGITCVLLKYRVPNAGPHWEQFCGCDTTTRSSRPLEDAQRTRGLVRFHAADSESCRPDFAVALYPGHLFDDAGSELNSDLPVTANTPPTFLVHAENDNVDGVSNTLSYYQALKNAGVPVEMHLYAEGRHAFGLRPTKLPITAWPRLAEAWLRTIGMISP